MMISIHKISVFGMYVFLFVYIDLLLNGFYFYIHLNLFLGTAMLVKKEKLHPHFVVCCAITKAGLI